MKRHIVGWLFGIVFIVFMSQCNGFKKIENVFKSQTPYEKYAETLKKAGLDNNLLGRNWLSAGVNAFHDSLLINLPYVESGFFSADNPDARVFNFLAQEGTLLQVNLEFGGDTATKIFVDLYKRNEEWKPAHVQSAEKDTTGFQYEIKGTGVYSLRVQPELLAQGFFELSLQTSAIYAFPVMGKNYRAIGSVFGDPRDNGRRKHEGVDIFAVKGTPVIAAVDGRITRVQERGLGGKVIWQWDNDRNNSLYYAHLDSQLVTPGQWVNVGDTIGLLGNTGNARFTPPHLHFGVYKRGYGARDPYPFLHQVELLPVNLTEKHSFINSWQMVTSKIANIRQSPVSNASIIGQVDKHTPLYIHGATKDWYRIILPDQTHGYIHQSLLAEIGQPIANISVPDKIAVLEDFTNEWSVIGFLEPESDLPVLGRYLNYLFVSFNGRNGWINQP